MAYFCELGSGQTIYLDNQGNQTIITTVSSSMGQQQQSSSGFNTGSWTSPPQVFQIPNGVIIKITTSDGEEFVQVQGSNISVTSNIPTVNCSQQLQLKEVSAVPSSSMEPMKPMEPMKAIEPMEPMKPMTMGDMSMSMNPMQMRMGNMTMQMGGNSSNVSIKQYCSQCGAKIGQNDRFCSSCGHRLS